MGLLSRPRDTAPESWTVLLNAQRQTPATDRVERLFALSTLVNEIGAAGQPRNGDHGGEFTEMKDPKDVFKRVIRGFEIAEIPYMIVGSFASTYHGLPRSTQDLDVVCDLHRSNVDALLEAFPAEDGFYTSREAAVEAVRRGGMFNLIHPGSGWKVDIIVKKRREFSQREFERRISATLLGQNVYVATPEDTILTKLEWAKDSLSERQLRDVAEVLDMQGEQLDREYLESGLVELGLEEVFSKVRGPW